MIVTKVNWENSDSISIFNPNLLHIFLHKYRPIPVELLLLRLVPVKPLSKTLNKSLQLIPQPLSLIYNLIVLSLDYDHISIIFFSLFKYLIEFCKICDNMK